jgi:hypothetical protein
MATLSEKNPRRTDNLLLLGAIYYQVTIHRMLSESYSLNFLLP